MPKKINPDKVIGFVVREKIAETISGEAGSFVEVSYRDVSRIYHAKSAAEDFLRLARKKAGQEPNDGSRFWITHRQSATA